MSAIQKTPLNQVHKDSGARMVEFAGWEMPVQYEGLRQEHECVRNNVGLFDVSHMGEIRVKGSASLETLQWLTSNDVSKLIEGKAQYSLLTNFDGGIVDDIIVYCLTPGEDYLVCVNAANTEKDFKWMAENNKGADITNESSDWAQIAVQGPKAVELGERVFEESISDMKPFTFLKGNYKGEDFLLARTGYTGEDGFEVFLRNAGAVPLWTELTQKGESLKVAPIGLGARDTLRTEMKYSLYGHEITDETNPIEAGLGWVVKLKKGDFIGRDKIASVKEAGPARVLVGFKLIERGIPRQGYEIVSESGEKVGFVTSGTLSPSTSEPIGIGYVPASLKEIGSRFQVLIRNKSVSAEVVETPFVK